MSPLAAEAVAAGVDAVADGDAAAAAGAEDDAEDEVVGFGGAVGGFGDGEAVGVVGAADLAAECGAEVEFEGLAVEPGGVGVLDQAGGADDGAGDADANGAGLAGQGLHGLDEALDGGEGGGVVALRGGDAAAVELVAVVVEGDGFDLGAAEVDTDPHGCRCAHGCCCAQGCLQAPGRCVKANARATPMARAASCPSTAEGLRSERSSGSRSTRAM